jgi:hypothetical protein
MVIYSQSPFKSISQSLVICAKKTAIFPRATQHYYETDKHLDIPEVVAGA